MSETQSGKVRLPDLSATAYQHGADHVPPVLRDSNYYALDPNMRVRLRMYLDATEFAWADEMLDEWGALCGGRIAELSYTANKHTPELVQFNEQGSRVDEIHFHPSYTEMAREAYGFGLAQMNHLPEFLGLARTPSRVVKAMAGVLFSAAEQGLYCPVFMTDCLIATLRTYADDPVKEKYLPRFLSLDPNNYYQGAQFMTEKFGGSDVGATDSRAVLENGVWRLYGDKWFCSNANFDLACTLARHDDAIAGTSGLGMFVFPRVLEDGQRNHFRINRIKEKLGTRSMASGEITLDGTVAYLVGPLEQGFKVMAAMLNGSRLGTATMATGSMRRAVMEAVHFARHRQTWGESIYHHGMVKRMLVDAYAETEGASALLAYAYHLYDRHDQNPTDPSLSATLRMVTALTKYNNSAVGVDVASECLQVQGGVGYIEDRVSSRLYRDALVHPIWEGTTNMLMLDILRAVQKIDADEMLKGEMEMMEQHLARNQTRAIFAPLRARANTVLAELRESLAESQVRREYSAYHRCRELATAVIGMVLLKEADFRLTQDDDPGGVDLAKAYLWKHRPDMMREIYSDDDRIETSLAVTDGLFVSAQT